MIGDDSATRIWEETWVPQLPHFRVFSRRETEDEMSLMVNELMENKRWKEGVLNSIFIMKDG